MDITYGMNQGPGQLFNPKIDTIKTTPPKWTISGMRIQ